MKTNEEKIRQTVFFLKPVLERKVRTMVVLTLWWQQTPDKNKQNPKKKKKKQATQTSEERRTSGTSPSAPHCTLLFASLGPSENFTQSSCNKQLSLSLKAINP